MTAAVVKVAAAMYASMLVVLFRLGSPPEARGATWALVQMPAVFLPPGLSCRGRGCRGGVCRSPCFGGPEGAAEQVAVQESQEWL